MERIKQFFTMEDALKGITQPMDYKYYKTLRLYLLIVNCWPADEYPDKMSITRGVVGLLYLMFYTWFVIASCLYIKNRPLSFLEITQVSTMVISYTVAALTVLLISLASNYKIMLLSFLNKMHVFYYKDMSFHAMEIHKRVHFLSILFMRISEFLMFSYIIIYNLGPIYSNYSEGNYSSINSGNITYVQAAYFAFPIDITSTLRGYIIGKVINGIESFFIGMLFQMVAVIIFVIVFHIWGHFKILIDDLNTFPKPSKKDVVSCKGQNVTTEMYSEDELKYISKRLHGCINYHRDIVNFTEEVSKAFGPALFVYYTYHQLNLCLLLLGCSQMSIENMTRYVPLTIMLVLELIQTSVIFELIGTMSEKLKDAVYAMPWENMDLKNRRTVLIFLINVQEPIYVHALGLAKIGVSSMATILKTSFSYYTFLRTSSK